MPLSRKQAKHFSQCLCSNNLQELSDFLLTYKPPLESTERNALLKLPLEQSTPTESLYVASFHLLYSPSPKFSSIVETLHTATSCSLHLSSSLHPTFTLILSSLRPAVLSRVLSDSDVLVLTTPLLLILSLSCEQLHLSSLLCFLAAFSAYPFVFLSNVSWPSSFSCFQHC